MYDHKLASKVNKESPNFIKLKILVVKETSKRYIGSANLEKLVEGNLMSASQIE